MRGVMSISQFSQEVDEILGYIEKLHQQSFSADFNEHVYASDVARLQEHLNDIPKVITKDESGNAITDEDGKQIYNSADLLELDRIQHIHEIAEQKLKLLEKLATSNYDDIAKSDIHAQFSNLQAKEAFFSGKTKDLTQRLDSAQSDADNVALVNGPLNKNVYTHQYEELVKGMVRGQDFKLTQNPVTKEYNVKMNGQDYNLSNIIKFANLTHLEFDQQDSDHYLTMLATKPTAYKPDVDKSDAALLAVAKGKINKNSALSEKEKRRQINGLVDNILLQNIAKENAEKPVEQRDYSLAEITSGERIAINIWTTGFFDCANPFLRGEIESTFERTRAMSELVGACKLQLMSDMLASGPEAGKLYLAKNAQGELIYTARTPQGVVVKDQVLNLKGVNLSNGELELSELNQFKDQIIAETTRRGHTAVKKNGREDALREMLCTTAFVMHGASYVSPNATAAQQAMYRGDDGLLDKVLTKRLEAAKTQNVISLNSITSTAQENPNVDFAFNTKDENKDKVKVGSIHTVIGKDISAISAFKREKEFLSVSRHKQYESVLKTGENEYLFKVRDVNAINQLAPEELFSRSEFSEIAKREKALNKQEKGILPAISKSQRKKIQSKKDENNLRKAELLQDRRVYLAKVAQLKKDDIDISQLPTVNHLQASPMIAASAPQHKRKRSDSIESRINSAEEYFAKKMKIVRDFIIPPITHETHNTVLTAVNQNPAPGATQTTQASSIKEDNSSNPLMLPTAQLKHLKELENELNKQPALENVSGGIEHLLLRKFESATAEAVKPKSVKVAAAADEKKDTGRDHKGLR